MPTLTTFLELSSDIRVPPTSEEVIFAKVCSEGMLPTTDKNHTIVYAGRLPGFVLLHSFATQQ
jgi:hypothetical protein